MTDLETAIAELRTLSKWGPWHPSHFHDAQGFIAPILSAVLSGEMMLTEAHRAGVAALIEEAADRSIQSSIWCDSQERTTDEWRNGVRDAQKHIAEAIRALIKPDAAAALDRAVRRAREEALEEAAKTVEIFDAGLPCFADNEVREIAAAIRALVALPAAPEPEAGA